MKAKLHNDSLFKGRQITVIPKRKNIPGHGAGAIQKAPVQQLMNIVNMMFSNRGRGRGGMPRGGFRGGRGGAPGAGATK